MNNHKGTREYNYIGPLSEAIVKFIYEKRAMGLKYEKEASRLFNFDKFTIHFKCQKNVLSKEAVDAWLVRNPNEGSNSQRLRVIVMNQLGRFMFRYGYDAYLVKLNSANKVTKYFIPHIYSDLELEKFFQQTDAMKATPHSPIGYIVIPALMRVFYCCGLRAMETCNLSVKDVDLDNGILSIKGAKYSKDRLVPMSEQTTEFCRVYSKIIHGASDESAAYFPTAQNNFYTHTGIYVVFRKLLRKAGISHGGINIGPRMHDFRHTFAVNCLKNWVKNNVDINNAIPYLATYLGHYDFRSSQIYLRLTSEMFPSVSASLEASIGNVIPEIGGVLCE